MYKSNICHAGIPIEEIDFISASINEYMPNLVYVQDKKGHTLFQSFKSNSDADSHLSNLLNYLSEKNF
jgi:hypothetical protein